MLKKSISIFTVAVAMIAVTVTLNAQDKMKKESGVMVGGAMMVKSKNIVGFPQEIFPKGLSNKRKWYLYKQVQ